MSKLSLFLLLGSLSTLSLANGSFNFRAGGDIYSRTSSLGIYSNGDTEDYGYEIGLEYLKPITEKLELGVGISYQNHSKIAGTNQENEKYYSFNSGIIEMETFKGFHDFQGYNSIPIYLTGKYYIANQWIIKPYIKANLGYSFNFGNEDIKYSDDVKNENESTDTDLGGQIFEAYSLSTDIKGGIYYAAGIGLEYKSLALESLYQVNEGKITINNNKYNSNYERISLILNYKF